MIQKSRWRTGGGESETVVVGSVGSCILVPREQERARERERAESAQRSCNHGLNKRPRDRYGSNPSPAPQNETNKTMAASTHAHLHSDAQEIEKRASLIKIQTKWNQTEPNAPSIYRLFFAPAPPPTSEFFLLRVFGFPSASLAPPSVSVSPSSLTSLAARPINIRVTILKMRKDQNPMTCPERVRISISREERKGGVEERTSWRRNIGKKTPICIHWGKKNPLAGSHTRASAGTRLYSDQTEPRIRIFSKWRK